MCPTLSFEFACFPNFLISWYLLNHFSWTPGKFIFLTDCVSLFGPWRSSILFLFAFAIPITRATLANPSIGAYIPTDSRRGSWVHKVSRGIAQLWSTMRRCLRVSWQRLRVLIHLLTMRFVYYGVLIQFFRSQNTIPLSKAFEECSDEIVLDESLGNKEKFWKAGRLDSGESRVCLWND